MPGERILIADDNKLVVKINSAILEREGYSISVAWDGIEAINKAYTERPDLMILDIEMPGVNGYQVCRLLKDDEYTRSIPIIMLTGRERQADVFWGMKTGADAYLVKGFKPEQLVALVREVIEKKRGAHGLKPARDTLSRVSGEREVLTRVIDILDRKLFHSTVLNELGSLSSLTVGFGETVRRVLEILAKVIGNSCGLVLLFGENVLIAHLSVSITRDFFRSAREKVFDVAKGLGWESEKIESLKVDIYGEELLSGECSDKECATAYIPLTAQKKVFGVLLLANPENSAFERRAKEILSLAVNQVAMVIDNARLYHATRKLAITDGLTRVFNHRFFQELVERECKRADRYNTVFSLIMLDIDEFKKINDTYGHLCGDEILKELANMLRSVLRFTDMISRYGGEEFAVLLPETGEEEALLTAERVRRLVEEHVFMEGNGGLRITVSLGVASYPTPGVHDRAALIERADRAMYRAKELGKNRAVGSRSLE